MGWFRLGSLWPFLPSSWRSPLPRGVGAVFTKQQLNHLFTASFHRLLLYTVLVYIRPEGCSLAGTLQATGTPPPSRGHPNGGGNPKVEWLLMVRCGRWEGGRQHVGGVAAGRRFGSWLVQLQPPFAVRSGSCRWFARRVSLSRGIFKPVGV